MPEDFDPRQAALNHAGMSAIKIVDQETSAPMPRYTGGLGDFASAIACGLVYVGDQIGVANGYLSGIANLLETIDATLSNRLGDIAAELQ